jgi:Chaperone of endosialidase
VGSLYPTCFTPTASQPMCAAGCSPLCVSDRNVKRDIAPVDEQAVLESVARVPVSTWSYKSDAPTVRHLGPMAQDFYAAFGLGDTDRAYNPIDAHGVALAAIKALYERSREQDARIERLEQQNRELRSGAACR